MALMKDSRAHIKSAPITDKNRVDEKKPIIIIDTREQKPLVFNRFESIRLTLGTGDYSIVGYENEFSIERKSLADLVGTMTGGRRRFIREMVRMQAIFFKRLLIVADINDLLEGNYRSKANPLSILNSVHAFECRYNIPVVWEPDADEAARMVERWAAFYVRG